MKIITLMLGLLLLSGCSTVDKKRRVETRDYWDTDKTVQQYKQQIAELMEAYDDIEKDYQDLSKSYQQCRQKTMPSTKDYHEIKQDYNDARQDYKQCQKQVSSLNNKERQCQRSLNLYKNQENYRQLPDKGFE